MNRARPTIADRITRSKIPVNGTPNPAMNAPATITTLTAAAVAWATARYGLDETTAALLAAAVGLALGIITQRFTVPAGDLLESSGPVRRRPDGQLGHRDQ